jgi:glycosyltransferase involved in cell wall biosynthesis
MKLLYIYPELTRCGPTNQSFYLLRGLVRNSISVSMFTFYRVERRDDEIRRFEDAGVKVYPFKLGLIGIYKSIVQLREINPEVVHSTLLVGDVLAFIVGWGRKRFLTHRTDPYDHLASRGRLVGRLMFYLSRFLSFKAYKSISCSNAIHQRLVNKGVKSDFVVQNCVSETFYSEFLRRERYFDIRAFRQEDRDLNVISIGALSKRKNPILTFKIFDHLSRVYKVKVTLTFVGDGELRSSLSALIPNENLKVYLVGQVGDVRPLISKAHIHCSASFAEGLPNSVLETLSCGVVNVLSAIPEHREFSVVAGRLVFLFPISGDVDDICFNLIRFLESPITVSDAYLDNFRDSFSEDRVARSYIKIYVS